MNRSTPARDSLLSTNSTTTYASTLSSLTSSLGLTESPLQPTNKSMAILEEVRDRSEEYRRQAMLRVSNSGGDLKRGAGGVNERVQSIENIRKATSSEQLKEGSTTRPRTRDTENRPEGQSQAVTQRPSSSKLRTRQSDSQLQVQQPQPEKQRQAARPQAAASAPVPTSTKNQIAVPNRRPPPAQVQSTLRPPQMGKQPSSPAPTTSDMAEDWEAELIRDAQNLSLHLRPQTSAAVVRQPSREKLPDEGGRDEWERAAMMIERRETGREEEERARRGPTREIAMPRLPIRAAPTGVTSIHIGVRPRIHPSRTEESISRNQPDPDLPEPLFSPGASAHASLDSPSGAAPPETVRRSYGTKYSADLAEKAKKEYEDWLARKDEREGGRGEEGYGPQQWVPRERTQARFGELNQPVSAYPDVGAAEAKMGAQMAGYEQSQGYGYGGYSHPQQSAYPTQQGLYPDQQTHVGGHHSQGYAADGQLQHGYGDYDPSQYPYGYWDPMAYWWAMAQMQGYSPEEFQAMMSQSMGGGAGLSPITSEDSSQGSSDDEQTPKVHFAPSPEKNKGTVKRQSSHVDLQQQQLQQYQQYADMYDL